MTRAAETDLERFLAEHPEVRFFDAFVNDLNTVERGKRIDRGGIAGVFKRGMPLPGSMFALDIEGGTVEATGLGFADGDADRPCMPIPEHAGPRALAARRRAGAAHHARTRRLAVSSAIRVICSRTCWRDSRASSLTPVVAIEYEFYLVDIARDAQRPAAAAERSADRPA